jgi:ABC-type cobalamin/Fe3+-siderophores transport system ATPase subunit
MSSTVSIRQLNFAYGDTPLLHDISVEVSRGEFVGLVGTNGSGKSTLLKLMLGSLRAGSGTILVEGESVDQLPRSEVAKRITLVPQESIADVAFRVRDIVAMGRTPYLGRFRPEGLRDNEAIISAMQLTDVMPLAERLLGELSGGERQRVVVARALAQGSTTTLFDEPISNLDIAHQLEVLLLIRRLTREGRSAIAALHDLALAARFCDRILLLSRGSIVADGAPLSVITTANLAQHFGIQARIDMDEETNTLRVWPIASTRDVESLAVRPINPQRGLADDSPANARNT